MANLKKIKLGDKSTPVISNKIKELDIIESIKDSISHYISPSRLALLLGIPEIELRNLILDNKELVKTLRTLIFNTQIDLACRLEVSLDKKSFIDFYQIYGDNHFDMWSRFIATDINMSSDLLLINNAIKGGIGADSNFWKGATNEIKQSFQTLLKNDLESFVRMAFSYAEGRNFELKSHHLAMFEYLVKAEKKELDVLIINIPPRCGKSTITYYWATRMLMVYKNANIIYTSYGDSVLTMIRKKIETMFKKSGDVVNPFYEIFNVSKVAGFSKEADFLTTINSAFFSATINGSVTGRGESNFGETIGALIGDDLVNPNAVGTIRMETTCENFDNTWESRRGDNPLVLPMQRVATNDIVTHLLQKYNQTSLRVSVLTLPLILTEEVLEYLDRQRIKYPNIDFVSPEKYMKIGEMLLDSKKVEYLKETMHPSVFKTQYLQIPTSFEGTIFKTSMFMNNVKKIAPVVNSNDRPIGYVKAFCEINAIKDDTITHKDVTFEGVFILHIDTTSGNLNTSSIDVDDCVWSVMIGGLKGRVNIDNGFGAILQQYWLNSKDVDYNTMQRVSLDIINEIISFYNRDSETQIYPKIVIAVETHALGGGLASYLKGLKIPNLYIISYSRQNFGNKKQRFLQGSGFYENRLFWYQGEYNIFNFDNGKIINEWFLKSRLQHLSVDGDNTRIHDDFVEAPCDLANLWISNNKDILYKEYIKSIKG